ncbi:hypothetical protein FRC10_001699 [Ceratobasidium sp. 414]|nr:hypothetical protein FRC10_001699 [Ceratobasidium sp. 414]
MSVSFGIVGVVLTCSPPAAAWFLVVHPRCVPPKPLGPSTDTYLPQHTTPECELIYYEGDNFYDAPEYLAATDPIAPQASTLFPAKPRRASGVQQAPDPLEGASKGKMNIAPRRDAWGTTQASPSAVYYSPSPAQRSPPSFPSAPLLGSVTTPIQRALLNFRHSRRLFSVARAALLKLDHIASWLSCHHCLAVAHHQHVSRPTRRRTTRNEGIFGAFSLDFWVNDVLMFPLQRNRDETEFVAATFATPTHVGHTTGRRNTRLQRYSGDILYTHGSAMPPAAREMQCPGPCKQVLGRATVRRHGRYGCPGKERERVRLLRAVNRALNPAADLPPELPRHRGQRHYHQRNPPSSPPPIPPQRQRRTPPPPPAPDAHAAPDPNLRRNADSDPIEYKLTSGKLGSIELVDANDVECLVGRITVPTHASYIIDRTTVVGRLDVLDITLNPE